MGVGWGGGGEGGSVARERMWLKISELLEKGGVCWYTDLCLGMVKV